MNEKQTVYIPEYTLCCESHGQEQCNHVLLGVTMMNKIKDNVPNIVV